MKSTDIKRLLKSVLPALLVPALLLTSCKVKPEKSSDTQASQNGGESGNPENEPPENGLWVSYFNGNSFETLKKNGIAESIDYSWENGKAPVNGLSRSDYSVIWEGRLKCEKDGLYTFTTLADDGAVLKIGGEEIIYDAGPHNPESHSGCFNMTSGTYYDIELKYYNGAAAGTISLSWESADAGIKKSIIPAEAFYLPEYPVKVLLNCSESGAGATARLTGAVESDLTLFLEKYDASGKLVDTLTEKRSKTDDDIISWEITDMDESKDITYTAYVKDAENTPKSYIITRKPGEDFRLSIDPGKKTGDISTLLYGACMEDVNHELYGGIWSQMIFGESFEEPATNSLGGGFTAAGGSWYTQKENGENILCIDKTADGPKLLIADSSCTSGSIEADVYVSGEGAGFIAKTTNCTAGADSFDGYEISVFNNTLRLGKHLHNYTLISDTPCTAQLNTWLKLKAVLTENTITVFINGTQIVSYTDPSPIKTGMFGFRAWNASAKYKNVTVKCDSTDQTEVSLPESISDNSVSGMWGACIEDKTDGAVRIITSGVYTGKQSQRLTVNSGTGSVSVNNMGLNRAGMSLVGGKDYNGYLYCASASPVRVYVSFTSADGKNVYCESSFIVNGSWSKYDFSLTTAQSDSKGSFAITIKEAGSVDIGYAFLEPGEWGLYKGLHVRRDVGELLEKQGVTVLRFGGCMANAADYKWKMMTGEPETRGTYKGWWYNESSYGFGIIEFLNLCEALGVEAVPDFNCNETPGDMVDFISFALGTDSGNEWVKLRISMGHPEPYKLKYIQIGNEERVNASYAAKFNAIANAVWAVNDSVTLVVGDFDYKDIITDPYSFPATSGGVTSLVNHKSILDNAAAHNRPVWFDIHFWSQSGTEPNNFINVAESFYKALEKICPTSEFKLCVFELNAASHDFERALCNALAINSAERMSDMFKIVCSANALQVDKQNDNGWDQGLVFMDNSGAWYQAPAYIDRMCSDAYLPFTVEYKADSDVNTALFDITVSADESGKTVAVKILNRTGEKKGISISIPAFGAKGADMKITAFTAAMNATNTTEKPENIKPSEPEVKTDALLNGSTLVSVAGYSFTTVVFTLK